MRPPRIALIGSRGVPARYGGFETLMENLAPRLGARGLEVTIYCRSPHTPRGARRFAGCELVVLPTLRAKYLDTPVHTLLACLHAARRRFDAALVVNGANVFFVPLLRLAGTPVALNVDGVERRRAKWGPPGRLAYALAERLASRWPDALVADAETIADYYRDRHGVDSEVIAYGVDPHPLPPGETLARLGLESRGYFLFVSRFEPENNPHRVAEAYRGVGGTLPLVMVGGAPYARRFIRGFTRGADPRILFPGAIYGDGYRELLSHALAYVQATEVGGTHPALVEAMGYGNCVVAHDVPEHREVLGASGLICDVRQPASLAAALERVRADPDLARRLGRRAAERAASRYSWASVADRYEALLRRLAEGSRHRRRR